MNLFWYTQLIRLLLPLLFARLWWRGRKQAAYRQHWKERLGHYSAPSTTQPVIWIHAVSVGETRAALPLITALQERYPTHALLLTHTTPTGRETAQDILPPDIRRVYLPYDLPGAVQRFLDTFRPCQGFLLETELWPRLIHECHRRQIPLVLANARLSARSATRYGRIPDLTRNMLGELTLIAAQSNTDADRLRSLGGNAVIVMGNLKFDAPLPPSHTENFARIRDLLGPGRQIWVAASTRDGEEALLLEHIQPLLTPPRLLILVPRHPQRFDSVAQLLERQGIRYVRRSQERPIPPSTQVLLGDSMGEMTTYFQLSQFALMGGTLLPLGGQNLLEALAVGCPVLLGPHTYNFSEATAGALAAQAARQFNQPDDLTNNVRDFLDHPDHCTLMGERGRAFIEQHRGATLRLLEHIPRTLHSPF
ncbi:MAG: 3-deoxy-D-manno-octulosonic acid transferase [Ferrovum sp.]|nr:3-deoxy-D-manno-octulosonic acid transferase [Ferrovum sp.]NDU88004.1 3-deoxy-D-manno-octulosonic acid transferase [Ferrovum sp.]